MAGKALLSDGYFGLCVGEEILENLDGSRSRLDGGMSNEGVFERN